MNLKELLEEIMLPFGFSEQEKQSVIANLIVVIAFAAAGMVAQKGESEDAMALSGAVSSKDPENIEAIVNKIALNPNYSNEMNMAFNQVMESWIEAVLPTIAPEKQQEVRNLVDSLAKK